MVKTAKSPRTISRTNYLLTFSKEDLPSEEICQPNRTWKSGKLIDQENQFKKFISQGKFIDRQNLQSKSFLHPGFLRSFVNARWWIFLIQWTFLKKQTSLVGDFIIQEYPPANKIYQPTKFISREKLLFDRTEHPRKFISRHNPRIVKKIYCKLSTKIVPLVTDIINFLGWQSLIIGSRHTGGDVASTGHRVAQTYLVYFEKR